MTIKIGSTSINQIYLGSTEINQAYLGETEVYNVSSDIDLDTVFDHMYIVGDDLIDVNDYEDNDQITTWTGRTNSNKSFTNVSTGQYVAEDLVNGHTACDGTNNRFSNATSVTWSGDWSAGWVVKINASPSSAQYMYRETGSNYLFHRAGSPNDSIKFNVTGSGGSINDEVSFTGQPLRGNWCAIIARYDNSEGRITVDLYAGGSEINLIDKTTSSVGDVVASNVAFSYDGSIVTAIAEFGVTESLISDSDTSTILGQWATKYDL